ncbi:craniofacial development protein 2-like [Coccinella septempunctata]|uniref:craniofacial development protein 2-like n=1 Tax=Coccinella septempunctata TaxID=41139 RepID=UPI001D08DD45|nr:craniofacial development protein 2-like [Coccinella septempunctata]
MSFGTWNVQGIRGKLEIVVKEIEDLKLDIITITETKKKGSGSEKVGEYVHLFSGVPKHERAKRGVSILIKNNLKSKITGWEAISENILKVNMTLYQRKITILAVYAISEDENASIKDDFFERLNEVVQNVGLNREIILMGDFNGRTGSRRNDKVVGPWGEHTVNDNGGRLVNLCESNELRIQNGFYKHKEIHKFTWIQPTRGLKSIIDYVITKQNTELKIVDVRVQRAATCGSDHHLIRAKICIPYTHRIQTEDREHNENMEEVKLETYNVESFIHESTQDLFKRRLDRKLDENLETIEDTYNNIISSLHETARETLGIKGRRKSTKVW